MRRIAIATVTVAAATVPLFLATLLLFGCCVLPFHQQVHRVIPLCHIASELAQGFSNQAGEQSTPAPEKREASKKLFTELTSRFALTPRVGISETDAATVSAAHRSHISLGAVRCDEDVGLHLLLLATLLI